MFLSMVKGCAWWFFHFALVLAATVTTLAQVPTAALDRAARATAFIRTDRAEGSGFVFAEDGYLLTCAHVVANATSVQVYLPDGRSLSARVVQSAPEIDAAILKVDAATPQYLRLGSSSSLGYGDAVAAIGFPSRVLTVTTGTVSAFPPMGELQILQITAPVNPGNSGGPLIRYSGEVVGIIFASADAAEFFRRYNYIPQALNWAIPIDVVKARFGLESANWRIIVEGQLVFEDDFTEPKAWPQTKDGRTFRFFAPDLLLGPSYHFISHNKGWDHWSYVPYVTRLGNFMLEVSARSASALPERMEAWTVVFRDQETSPQAYYRLRVHTNGSFDLYCKRLDKWYTIQTTTYSEHIARDREVNNLRLIVKGNMFIVEINGVEILRIPDSSITTPGRIGLGVSVGQEDFAYTHIVFTNVRLYRLP